MNSRDAMRIRWSVWLYARLLALYPVSFQNEYRRELVLTFGKVCRRENERHGLGGLLSYWLEVSADLASTALLEHLAEVRMLTQRESLVRLTGIIGALGGVLAIVIGYAFLNGFGDDPAAWQLALWILVYALIAVGTTGYFLAGRHDPQSSAALGTMLLGAIAATAGAAMMVSGLEQGWGIWPIGVLIHGAGLLLLGIATKRLNGLMSPNWLPLLGGIAIMVLLFLSFVTEQESFFGIFVLTLGGVWVSLGLLLMSGYVRTDAQPPTVA